MPPSRPRAHPMAHCSFAYSQRNGYVFLLPPLLFQLPGLFASFFSPIGFLWCSHTSYPITLYFLLPLSVDSLNVKFLPDQLHIVVSENKSTAFINTLTIFCRMQPDAPGRGILYIFNSFLQNRCCNSLTPPFR